MGGDVGAGAHGGRGSLPKEAARKNMNLISEYILFSVLGHPEISNRSLKRSGGTELGGKRKPCVINIRELYIPFLSIDDEH